MRVPECCSSSVDVTKPWNLNKETGLSRAVLKNERWNWMNMRASKLTEAATVGSFSLWVFCFVCLAEGRRFVFVGLKCSQLSLSTSYCVVCFSMPIPDIVCALSCDEGRWDMRPCAAGVRGEHRRLAGFRPLNEELLLTCPEAPRPVAWAGRETGVSLIWGDGPFDIAVCALEKDNRMVEWSAA